MHASSCAPGLGGFASFMSDNSDSNEPAKFEALKHIRAEIPYSPVLQEMHRNETQNAATGGI
jgi:hypothetical protein